MSEGDSGAEVVPPDPVASSKGVEKPRLIAPPKEKTAADLAKWIFLGAGLLAVVLISTATAVVLIKGAEASAGLLAFYGSIISALGTLLGGIIGYYFGTEHNED